MISGRARIQKQTLFFFILMNQGGRLLLDTADSLLRLLRCLGGPASGFDNVILPPSGQVVARLFTDGARRPLSCCRWGPSS